MRKYIFKALRYIRKVLIFLVILIIIDLGISRLTGAVIAEVFQYTGMACILFGLFSIIGNRNMSTNITYLQSKSVSNYPISEWADDELKSRNGSFRFLMYMLITGGLMILIGMVV